MTWPLVWSQPDIREPGAPGERLTWLAAGPVPGLPAVQALVSTATRRHRDSQAFLVWQRGPDTGMGESEYPIRPSTLRGKLL